jgi:predicted nucleic acid-binding protein
VKLAVHEPETAALEVELLRWPLCATSSITAIEVTRATARARGQERDVLAPSDIEDLLAITVEMVMTDRVRQTASKLTPPGLRTLDAIHVASALALGDDLAAVVTYDVACSRLPRAATSWSWRQASRGATAPDRTMSALPCMQPGASQQICHVRATRRRRTRADTAATLAAGRDGIARGADELAIEHVTV